jgi:hypothetical protein
MGAAMGWDWAGWDWAGWIVAAVLALILAGQSIAATADFFIAVANPRPVGERTLVITARAWGFVMQSPESRFVAGGAGQGLSDVRFYATPRQALTSFITLGFLRPVSIVYRHHAGSYPMGDA